MPTHSKKILKASARLRFFLARVSRVGANVSGRAGWDSGRTARIGVTRPTKDGAHSPRRAKLHDAPYLESAADLISRSYGKGPLRVRFLRVCCKGLRLPLSATRARRFAVPSKNSTSRAGHEGIRPFHAKARPLWRRDPAIPAHRQSGCQGCDRSQSRASSIRANHPGKALRPCKARLFLQPQAGPRKPV